MFIIVHFYTNRCSGLQQCSLWFWCWSNPPGQCCLQWQWGEPHWLSP